MRYGHYVADDREMRQSPDEGLLTGEVTNRITTLEGVTQYRDGGDAGQRQNNNASVLLACQIPLPLKVNKPVRLQVFSANAVSQYPDALLLHNGIDQPGEEAGAYTGAFGSPLPDQAR